jgi:hypothetical protein
MKNEKSGKKYTIRVDEEDHSLLLELFKDFGTLENALKKVIEYYKKGRENNELLYKTR